MFSCYTIDKVVCAIRGRCLSDMHRIRFQNRAYQNTFICSFCVHVYLLLFLNKSFFYLGMTFAFVFLYSSTAILNYERIINCLLYYQKAKFQGKLTVDYIMYDLFSMAFEYCHTNMKNLLEQVQGLSVTLLSKFTAYMYL